MGALMENLWLEKKVSFCFWKWIWKKSFRRVLEAQFACSKVNNVLIFCKIKQVVENFQEDGRKFLHMGLQFHQIFEVVKVVVSLPFECVKQVKQNLSN